MGLLRYIGITCRAILGGERAAFLRQHLPLSFFDFLLLLSVVTLITLQLDRFADDPGVGWHLRTGEFIAARMQIPDYDPFLLTDTRRPWISDQWLSDLVFYLLHVKGGWVLNYGFFIIVYVLTFYGVLYAGVRKVTGASLLAALAAFLAFKQAELHFIFRAAMVGFFFFAYTYVLLYALLKRLQRGGEDIALLAESGSAPGGGEGKDYWGIELWLAYLLVPLLFVAWANMHPSFILGLVLLALAPLSLVLDRVVRGRGSSPGAVFKLSLLFVLALVR